MELIYQNSANGLKVWLIRELGKEWELAEQEILAAGVSLPLQHRQAWGKARFAGESWLLVVRDAHGAARACAVVEKRKTRAFPGHSILRVDKFGGDLSRELVEALAQSLRIIAGATPNVLKLQVNVSSRNAKVDIGRVFASLGFREIVPPSWSRHTLVIDLRPTEEEIFALFGKNTRKRIKDIQKESLSMHVLAEQAYAPRLKWLQLEAMKRTGGPPNFFEWPQILDLSRLHPDLSQVVGLFVGDDPDPDQMAAFVWVCVHGEHAEYRSAGSTRIPGSKVTLGYPLLWEIIRFAKASGCQWFDMGGVTLEEAGGSPSMKGISDFKRHFTKEVVEIGAEWELVPSKVKAGIAGVVSFGSQNLRRLMPARY